MCKQHVGWLQHGLDNNIVGLRRADRDQHVADLRPVIEPSNTFTQLGIAVDVRIVDFCGQQRGKLVLVVTEQLVQANGMHATFCQVDINLLFPNGLGVFKIERRESHRAFS